MAKKGNKKRNVGVVSTSVHNCQANECKNLSRSKCEYCNRYYCDRHTETRLVTNPRTVWSMEKSNPLLNELVHEWNLNGGHPCPNYTELRYRRYREESNRQDIDWNAVLEKRRLTRTEAFSVSGSERNEETAFGTAGIGKQESWYRRHGKAVNAMIVLAVVVLLLLAIAFGL